MDTIARIPYPRNPMVKVLVQTTLRALYDAKTQDKKYFSDPQSFSAYRVRPETIKRANLNPHLDPNIPLSGMNVVFVTPAYARSAFHLVLKKYLEGAMRARKNEGERRKIGCLRFHSPAGDITHFPDQSETRERRIGIFEGLRTLVQIASISCIDVAPNESVPKKHRYWVSLGLPARSAADGLLGREIAVQWQDPSAAWGMELFFLKPISFDDDVLKLMV